MIRRGAQGSESASTLCYFFLVFHRALPDLQRIKLSQIKPLDIGKCFVSS